MVWILILNYVPGDDTSGLLLDAEWRAGRRVPSQVHRITWVL